MVLIVRWLLYAAALAAAAQFVTGIQIQSYGAALLAAFVIGLLNALLRPFLILLTLPVTVLTMGLFLFVINALVFWLAAELIDGFRVQGFMPALLASFIYSTFGIVIDVAVKRLFARR